MKFDTKVVHAGITPDPTTGSIVPPIYQTATYVLPEVGRDLLDRFTGMLEDVAKIDRPPAIEGRQMSIVLEPRKGEPKTDDAEASDGAADAGTTPETSP